MTLFHSATMMAKREKYCRCEQQCWLLNKNANKKNSIKKIQNPIFQKSYSYCPKVLKKFFYCKTLSSTGF